MFFRSISTQHIGIYTLGLTCSMFAATTANAADLATANNVITLPSSSVTGTFIPTKTTDLIGDVLVIDENEIKTHQGQTALEVLAEQPSVRVSRSGGLGTVSGVSLRGANNQHTLVLIDGVRYGSASAGGSALSLIPASQIERIEVLYGSAATSMYGSDAIGGVVQVFTKQGGYGQTNASLTIGGGMQQSYNAAAQVGVGGESVRFGVGASYDDTQGINAVAKPNPANPYDLWESDKDGFTNKSLNLNGGVKLSPNTELSLTGLYGKSNTQFDSGDATFKTHSTQENGAGNIALTSTIGQATLNLSHGVSLDDIVTPAYGSRFKTTQVQSKARLNYDTGFGVVSASAEQLKQELSGSTNFTTSEREITSGILGYQLVGERADAQLAVRYDDNDQFGSETTYSVGGAYQVVDGIRLGGSFATGFRAPTFIDLYWPVDPVYGGGGNPDLKPETSKNGEVFAQVSGKQFTTRLTGYQNKIDNLIANYQNVNEAKIQGVSLKSDWDNQSWFAGFHYDYIDAIDSKTDKQLTHRAKNAGGVYAGFKANDYRLKAEVTHTGKRFTDQANTDELDAYTLLNISGTMRLSPWVDVGVAINNLTGEDYVLSQQFGTTYNTLGTNATASVTFHTP